MNHIARDFKSGDGRVFSLHSWELRHGGYRKNILYWGNGLWPVSRDTRLVGFLIERGFRVLALDLAFGSASPPSVDLRSFRRIAGELVTEVSGAGLPVYIIASAFSASALVPILGSFPKIEAVALIAPVFHFPPAALKASFPCFIAASLHVDAAFLSGEPELLRGLVDTPKQYRFKKRDIRNLASERLLSTVSGLGDRTAVFAGEEDPLVGRDELQSLKDAGLRLYTYPRVRREIGRDRYADNFYADLGSFLGEMESRPSAAKRKV
jgi:hypothetical protein